MKKLLIVLLGVFVFSNIGYNQKHYGNGVTIFDTPAEYKTVYEESEKGYQQFLKDFVNFIQTDIVDKVNKQKNVEAEVHRYDAGDAPAWVYNNYSFADDMDLISYYELNTLTGGITACNLFISYDKNWHSKVVTVRFSEVNWQSEKNRDGEYTFDNGGRLLRHNYSKIAHYYINADDSRSIFSDFKLFILDKNIRKAVLIEN